MRTYRQGTILISVPLLFYLPCWLCPSFTAYSCLPHPICAYTHWYHSHHPTTALTGCRKKRLSWESSLMKGFIIIRDEIISYFSQWTIQCRKRCFEICSFDEWGLETRHVCYDKPVPVWLKGFPDQLSQLHILNNNTINWIIQHLPFVVIQMCSLL